jgi:hypothetical protein
MGGTARGTTGGAFGFAAGTEFDRAVAGDVRVWRRATHDGGAAEVGIATLILPPAPATAEIRGLHVVTRMVGAG